MPDDATGPTPDPTATTASAPITTATAAEPREPKWGDDPETIPQARRHELWALHEAQLKWLAETGPDRDYKQSPFAQATGWQHNKPPLTGAEVNFILRSLPYDYNLHLEGAILIDAHLEGAILTEARLEGADLRKAHLEDATLFQAHLEGADLRKAHLEDATLFQAHLEGADFGAARLQGANFAQAHLEGADLSRARLEGADFGAARLEGVNLSLAHLEGADLREAHLEDVDLRGAFFDTATDLTDGSVFNAKFGMPQLADVRWQDVNLAVVSWPERPVLGDERAARESEKSPLMKPPHFIEPLPKDATRDDRRRAEAQRHEAILDAWREAARAYRQVASVMRDQGMSDEADRFAYQGQVCQRELYRVQGKRVRRAFSRFLDLLAGYGYKPERSLIAYLLIIAAFAVAYFIIGQTVGPHLSPFGAFVFSMTSFHGRGFFPGGISVDDPLTGTAAFEALAGLIIEISFIATFTQRFFGK